MSAIERIRLLANRIAAKHKQNADGKHSDVLGTRERAPNLDRRDYTLSRSIHTPVRETTVRTVDEPVDDDSLDFLFFNL